MNDFSCPFNWVLIMSAVVNSVSNQDQGCEEQSHTQGHSVETAANQRMSSSLQHISSSGFLMWGQVKMALDILTLNCLSVCLFISVLSVCLSFSVAYTAPHFGSLKFSPLKPFIILVNPTCTMSSAGKMELIQFLLTWTDLFTDSLFFSYTVPCMPFERAELAFPCSSNESGSCPFQSLFLLSNNPLCCSALIWLHSFSAGFNTEVRVCRSGKTVKGILGTWTVLFPVQLRQ